MGAVAHPPKVKELKDAEAMPDKWEEQAKALNSQLEAATSEAAAGPLLAALRPALRSVPPLAPFMDWGPVVDGADGAGGDGDGDADGEDSSGLDGAPEGEEEGGVAGDAGALGARKRPAATVSAELPAACV